MIFIAFDGQFQVSSHRDVAVCGQGPLLLARTRLNQLLCVSLTMSKNHTLLLDPKLPDPQEGNHVPSLSVDIPSFRNMSGTVLSPPPLVIFIQVLYSNRKQKSILFLPSVTDN